MKKPQELEHEQGSRWFWGSLLTFSCAQLGAGHPGRVGTSSHTPYSPGVPAPLPVPFLFPAHCSPVPRSLLSPLFTHTPHILNLSPGILPTGPSPGTFWQVCEPENPCRDQTHSCHRHADCIYLGHFSEPMYKCECSTGYAGDGQLCGEDSDLDGWPNQSLRCAGNGSAHCLQVSCLGHCLRVCGVEGPGVA